jgi:hypothetical protein
LGDKEKVLDVGKLVFGVFLNMAPPGLLGGLPQFHLYDGGFDAGGKKSPPAMIIGHRVSHNLFITKRPGKFRLDPENMGLPAGRLPRDILRKVMNRLNFVKGKVYNWSDHFDMADLTIGKQGN